MPRKPTKPILIAADANIDVARILIALAHDNPQAAHDLITKALKQRHDKPDEDIALLLKAAAIQKHDRQCSRRSVLLRVIRREEGDEKKIRNKLRQLEDRLRGKTLAQFAQSSLARKQGYYFVYKPGPDPDRVGDWKRTGFAQDAHHFQMKVRRRAAAVFK